MADNYQKQLDQILSSLPNEGERKKLMLHVCCAPCASYVLDYLTKYFNITVFFFNPNIYPDNEYLKRLDELKKLLKLMPDDVGLSLIDGQYQTESFDAAVMGMEAQQEGGSRCRACIQLRLEETARAAMSGNFDYFCTTLTISPHKNANIINELGKELSIRYGIKFLPSDFKKKEGYKRSIELCSKYDIYRQNYCGCRYSAS